MQHRVIIYGTADDQWRWRRVASNGRIVADGAESYHNVADCQDMAVKVNAQPYVLEMQAVNNVESSSSQALPSRENLVNIFPAAGPADVGEPGGGG